MAKFIITLRPMPAEQVKTACFKVVSTAEGTGLTMDWAYVDNSTNQPICCWDAPDRKAIEDLFSRAGQDPESIRAVTVYHAPGA
ncbi:hypothetical protein FJY69_10115 [candidate division WOR-3 bacterium]|nr:hypothetical protein [candidate division WOR-3 bacterium]